MTRDSRLHPTTIKKARRRGALLAIVVMTSLLQVAAPPRVQAADVPVIEPGRTQPGKFVTVRGVGIDPLEERYTLFVGEHRVGRKLIRRSSAKLIEFQVQVDPGTYSVSLVPPADERAVDIKLGTVTVEKYILPGAESEIVPAQIQVRLAPGVSAESVADEGDSFVRQFPDDDVTSKLGRWHLVEVPAGDEVERIKRYAADKHVEVAQFVGVSAPDRAPNDPCYRSSAVCGSDQWAVRKTRLTAAWEVRTAGNPIAIVDTGLPASHPDLGTIDPRRDSTGTGLNPCNDHGTAVATTAAAVANNSQGLAGASWGTRVGSYKAWGFAPDCTGGTLGTARLENAMRAAITDGFQVINVSGGTTEFTASMRDLVNQGWGSGAMVIASAGNGVGNDGNGCDCLQYPAAFENAIAVAATTSTDARASFSNFGAWVDISAPGVGIPGARVNGTYTSWSGTSMAAPLVSGAAALLRAAGVNHINTRARLLGNTDPLNWSGGGTGRLNAYRALVPGSGCIRDIPNGAWAHRGSTGAIYHVQGANTLRYVGDATIMDNWKAWGDMVPICEERFAEMVVGTSWGFRPGTVIHDTGIGAVYLVTADGDRGLPIKRRFANPTVLSCLGFTWPHQNVSSGTANIHPTGPDIGIDSCPTAGARKFPNGSWIHHPSTGRIYVIDGGAKRYVPSLEIYTSWMGGPGSGYVNVTDLEASLLPDGPQWGFRQGRLVQRGSVGTVYFVTDDGALRAHGSRRGFMTLPTFQERGFSSVPIVYNVGSALDIHREGVVLNDADDMI